MNFKTSDLLFVVTRGRFGLRITYDIEIVPLILSQQIYISFLQLMSLFAGYLGGRKTLVLPFLVTAEGNMLSEDEQILNGYIQVLGFCPVEKYCLLWVLFAIVFKKNRQVNQRGEMGMVATFTVAYNWVYLEMKRPTSYNFWQHCHFKGWGR